MCQSKRTWNTADLESYQICPLLLKSKGLGISTGDLSFVPIQEDLEYWLTWRSLRFVPSCQIKRTWFPALSPIEFLPFPPNLYHVAGHPLTPIPQPPPPPLQAQAPQKSLGLIGRPRGCTSLADYLLGCLVAPHFEELLGWPCVVR